MDTRRGQRCGLKVHYIRAVQRAGGAPVLLPNSPDPEHARAAAARADALVLTGGGDVDPALYGQAAHPATANVDADRDATEAAAIAEVMARGRPILAICRGIQMLNVALGGTLIQDIPTSLPAGLADAPCQVNHAGSDHPVRLQAGSLSARIWGGREATANRRHHQAVDDLAGALKATAWAPDGIIEAAESTDEYPLLALQCHPEDLWEDPRFLAPFRWLVDQAAKRS